MIRRILGIIVVAIGSYIAVAVGILQDHTVLLYSGMVVAGILTLGLVVWLVKVTARFIGWAFTSVLYLMAAMAIVGYVTWQGMIPAFAGFMLGCLLGVCLVMVIIRRLAKWAQNSILWSEVYSFLSAYEIRSFLVKDTIVDRDTNYSMTVDFKNVVLVLRDMQFSKAEARDAAMFACEKTGVNEPIEAKIQKALYYLNEPVMARNN